MVKLNNISFLIIAVFIFATACKSNSDADLEFPEEFRDVIWEFYEEGQDSSDFFIEFTEDELFFTDNFYEDCFFVSKGTLVNKKGERYTIEEVYDGEIEGSSAYIKRINNELWVSGVESYETKEIYIQSERTKSSFVPKCEDSPLKRKSILLRD
jgi:hypothetical protein